MKIIIYDLNITSFLFNLFPHNHFFDLFFSFLSHPGRYLIWMAIIIFLVIYEEKKDKHFIIYFLISLLTTIFVVNIVIKNIFQRPRPMSQISNFKFQISNCPQDYSFPSAHAATAFAAAAILSAFDKKRRLFYYFIALAISYSRIYLGCHYFFDVFIGASIGYFISQIIFMNRLNLSPNYIKTSSEHAHGARKGN